MLLRKEQTCCFAGHRKFPIDQIEHIIKRLNQEVDKLINQGVTDFISSGALGFDQIAASLIVAKKEMGINIRLIFALLCRNQEESWNAEQKRLYRNLLAQTDEIIYISERCTDECIKKRNRYIVDRSAYCICTQMYPKGGTAQTVKYARQKRLEIINVAVWLN